MPKRILGIFLLMICAVEAMQLGKPFRPDGAIGDPNSPHANDIYARTIEQAFKEGYVNGHAGFYAQQASHKDPTFVDLNMSASYETLRFKGYKIGIEAWLNAQIFQANANDFFHNKDIFILSNIYGDFYNPYEKFGIRVGRYKIDEEWITHNTEGFSVDYDGLENISLHFSWAFRNAYVEKYFACDFNGCDQFGDRINRAYNVVGALYLRSTFNIPVFPVKITPYFYIAPGIFFTTALKADMDLPIGAIDLRANTQLISYVQSRGYYGNEAGNGFLFLLDSSIYWEGLEGGIGMSATDSHGASMIDAFGQHSVFERPVGMYWGGATTVYGYMKYKMNYLELLGAIRNTFINGKNVFNWELKASGKPVFNLQGLELGLGLIGMDNTSDAIDYFGGKQYLLIRGFVQFKF